MAIGLPRGAASFSPLFSPLRSCAPVVHSETRLSSCHSHTPVRGVCFSQLRAARLLRSSTGVTRQSFTTTAQRQLKYTAHASASRSLSNTRPLLCHPAAGDPSATSTSTFHMASHYMLAARAAGLQRATIPWKGLGYPPCTRTLPFTPLLPVIRRSNDVSCG